MGSRTEPHAGEKESEAASADGRRRDRAIVFSGTVAHLRVALRVRGVDAACVAPFGYTDFTPLSLSVWGGVGSTPMRALARAQRVRDMRVHAAPGAAVAVADHGS